MKKPLNRFKAFLKDEDGLILAETVMMLPLLIWALVAMFIYWDVFRTVNVTQKAAYSIADLLSRQRDTIPTAFLNGLQNIGDFLTPGGHELSIRVTSFECVSPTRLVCDANNGSYRLLFSRSPQNKVPDLTQAQIQSWRGVRIPIMNNGDSLYVVETQVDFRTQMKTVLAGFMVAVEDGTYGTFVVTRPRHRRLCLEGTNTCT
ncbi:TadE/TadG family type IV pilus assembly protein [Tabrizicola sp.]|uniref:TadE/TadG family type IV pilus assembly protein n=1 Tax=Tabrizicola sp. TaxID=2005166 RepID=UPI0035B139CD